MALLYNHDQNTFRCATVPSKFKGHVLHLDYFKHFVQKKNRLNCERTAETDRHMTGLCLVQYFTDAELELRKNLVFVFIWFVSKFETVPRAVHGMALNTEFF